MGAYQNRFPHLLCQHNGELLLSGSGGQSGTQDPHREAVLFQGSVLGSALSLFGWIGIPMA